MLMFSDKPLPIVIPPIVESWGTRNLSNSPCTTREATLTVSVSFMDKVAIGFYPLNEGHGHSRLYVATESALATYNSERVNDVACVSTLVKFRTHVHISVARNHMFITRDTYWSTFNPKCLNVQSQLLQNGTKLVSQVEIWCSLIIHCSHSF